MITVEQCRAARGLLGWTQQNLADACGLSKTAVNNFERGLSHMKAESLYSIQSAFENRNVELLGDDGVRKVSDNVKILKGPDVMVRLWDDIFETMNTLDPADRMVRVSYVDEKRTLESEGDALISHLNRLKDNNIRERLLVCEGDQFFVMPKEYYRAIPKELFTFGMSTYVYKDKVALQLWQEAMIILVNSHDAFNAEMARFDDIWNRAKVVGGAI